MDEADKFLIIGLGNPGAQYRQTRHNAGFNVVDAFAKKHQLSFRHTSHLIGDVAQGSVHGKKVLLLLPTTFMNSSGDAARRCIDYFKVPITQVMVVCDDVVLPIGTLRMRSKGSSGGHNGLKSLQAHLNTEYYARLRIGVGGPGSQEMVDYVLGKFSSEEEKILQDVALKAIEVLELWLTVGIAAAMQAANSVKNKNEEGEKNG